MRRFLLHANVAIHWLCMEPHFVEFCHWTPLLSVGDISSLPRNGSEFNQTKAVSVFWSGASAESKGDGAAKNPGLPTCLFPHKPHALAFLRRRFPSREKPGAPSAGA